MDVARHEVPWQSPSSERGLGRTKRSESTKPAKRPVIVDNLSVGTLADLEKVLDELGTWKALATANQGRRG